MMNLSAVLLLVHVTLQSIGAAAANALAPGRLAPQVSVPLLLPACQPVPAMPMPMGCWRTCSACPGKARRWHGVTVASVAVELGPWHACVHGAKTLQPFRTALRWPLLADCCAAVAPTKARMALFGPLVGLWCCHCTCPKLREAGSSVPPLLRLF